MMDMDPWLMLLIFVAALAAGVLLVLAGRMLRRRHGLHAGKTIARDNRTLYSHRLGLCGRPDRIVRAGNEVFPEEWKSSRQVWPSHRAQLGVYFLLIEEHYGIRPTHGMVVCGDGSRHRVENDAAIRAWVLDLARQIRSARRSLHQPTPVNPHPAQCRPCGLRGHCSQARLR
jgi:CRISPR-associated exonuclease Cas4